MYGGYLQEAKLISYAYDLEQEIQPRSAPQFIPPLPHEPPDAGICTMGSAPAALRRVLPYHLGTGKPLPR